MYCIYRITNKLNGHTYIGQHKYTDRRNPMKRYKGSGIALHLAYKKYGFDNFGVEILQQNIQTRKLINALEKYFIAKYKPEYNIAEGGQGGFIVPISEEHKHKMSEAHKGKPHPHKGSSHSEETKRKISEAMKGKSTWNKGTHWYNNGVVSVQAKECPEGYVKGRIR